MSYLEDMRLYYSEQPHEVSIETFAYCNARCTFCPYPTLERIGAKMPDELIDRLIDEMAEFKHPFYFSPFKVNEPLLDKRLIPICRKFNEKAPRGFVRIFSNGSALTEKNVEGIAGLKKVAHLWISLNSHDPKEYEELMGLDFEHTVRNLDRLHETPFPHVVVVSRVGISQPFLEFVMDRWPRFRPAIIKHDSWIDFEEQRGEVPESPCGRWWELNITATGKAALCCMDGEAKYGFGDVNDMTLLELYNHPTLKKIREGNRYEAGDPCNRCTY